MKEVLRSIFIFIMHKKVQRCLLFVLVSHFYFLEEDRKIQILENKISAYTLPLAFCYLIISYILVTDIARYCRIFRGVF